VTISPPQLEQFSDAVSAYVAQDLERAQRLFSEFLALQGGSDGPAELYLSRIVEALESSPGGEWDGVIRFSVK
jgi:hypothetical protein